jgi:arylformamidase
LIAKGFVATLVIVLKVNRPPKTGKFGLMMRKLTLATAMIAIFATSIPADAGRLRDLIRARREMRNPEKPAIGGTEYSYGSNSLQKLDFWPARGGSAPLVVFVHGGGWKRGDMDNATGKHKPPHYNGLGYAFASINYRLVPDATVEQQAADVASSVAWFRANAGRLGIDANRIVLMGHSAGAHLVALVGTDERYLRGAGLSFADLSGVIPLDGAAYDVPGQMVDGNRFMQKTYAQAFGPDPVRQRALSPTLQAASPNASSFLILHVQREDGARQSAGLADALRSAGANVQLQGFAGEGLKGHMEIKRSLGDPNYPATPVVDAWLARVFGK